ncbi:MAG: hypothetical protein A3A28_02525 [Candidatus Sungbacteria bacterium RIFCSPLOWO2_01_FULL_47_32]|uniref:Probable cytosol aminopeptidase n=1 Tax=Candidatus Sungbacteria bacterium RIFCSPHIGHO2_01_FULL_47_32 TaxID=1802264 RepID=A0A1G2K7I6_9BACT|nr:MAG: putative cytosol aminopeptidase [Parcubacteria group bacterium GW2011_GWA2_47_10]OGZ94388.1 MAG: hypothetical protein A2633_02170 [Candidatus Sungbacteria bacterium RIFCSPHIGHO2_01_FULL_47_32]OHA04961.1 MAG: hypothetical protein A3A28_02525 [Candidatus Sungbacteria bacterium RIFCSPLOWO2_01_FULL_47_32]
MKIFLSAKPTLQKNKAVVVCFFNDKERTAASPHSFFKTLPAKDASYLADVMKHDFTTSQEKFREVHFPSNPDHLVVFANLGKKDSWDEKKWALFVRKAVVYMKDRRIPSFSVFLGDFAARALSPEYLLKTLGENALMADSTFSKFKEAPKEGWPVIKDFEIISPDAKSAKLAEALKSGITIGEEVNACRELSNMPGSDMTPRVLANAARRIGKRAKIKVTVLEENAMKKLGMGGVLGVSKGSDEKPQFIILEYKSPKANKKTKPLVFAGKGVTFDTGGLNIKPGEHMYEMHMDMAGGAAVMHALAAIARMKLPVHIIGLVPAVENMPSGSSYHPGDILKTITGKTIEVLNTDAEGRVILADALGYAQRFNPKLILSVATLTGAAVVAVGQKVIALFSTSEKLEFLMREVGKVSGDAVWPLPMGDEYLDEVKGTFGDVANVGKSKYGGATAGAIFLKQFVGNFPFVHLDIAPTMTTIEGQYLAKGASGSGVRFLVELAKNVNKIP